MTTEEIKTTPIVTEVAGLLEGLSVFEHFLECGGKEGISEKEEDGGKEGMSKKEEEDGSDAIMAGEASSPPPLINPITPNATALFGYYFNETYNVIKFTPAVRNAAPPAISYPTHCLLGKSVKRTEMGGDVVFSVLNSCNGLLLVYFSTFLKGGPSYFEVRNPITSDKTNVYPSDNSIAIGRQFSKRFLVYGFAFEPLAPNSHFTIVEITDVVRSGTSFVSVSKWNSLCPRWSHSSHYSFPSAESPGGPSVYYDGKHHWLLGFSGVVSFDVQTDSFDFLQDIPGDTLYIDQYGLCRCLLHKGCGADPDFQCTCTCRHLGECRGSLVYGRVTGDAEISLWTLLDYSTGKWSGCARIRVNDVPDSLFKGRILAFDMINDDDIVVFKSGKYIYWYNCVALRVENSLRLKEYYDCEGFFAPLKVPLCGPPSMPKRRRVDSTPKVSLTPEQAAHYQKLSQRVTAVKVPLFRHFGVLKLSRKIWPNLPFQTDMVRPPFRCLVDLFDHLSLANLKDARKHYSELIRLEAALYGYITGCDHGMSA